jgi:hypothetical protein
VSEAGLTPTQKGNVAEAKIACAAIELGIGVLKPVQEGLRYDLLFDFHPELARVQCKTARRQGDVLVVNLTSSWLSPRGYVRSSYTADEIDAVAAYAHDLDRCFYLPAALVADRRAIQLRLAPARNGQRAAIRWASTFDLGAVAQLGRAPAWHAGGRGFESHQLHSPSDSTIVIGAHELRERFGYWMERAAGGEDILVTRHGTPHIRLSAP